MHKIVETQHDDYLVSTDPARLDPARVHAFLIQTHWAADIPPAVVQKSLSNSLCFGLYHKGE